MTRRGASEDVKRTGTQAGRSPSGAPYSRRRDRPVSGRPGGPRRRGRCPPRRAARPRPEPRPSDRWRRQRPRHRSPMRAPLPGATARPRTPEVARRRRARTRRGPRSRPPPPARPGRRGWPRTISSWSFVSSRQTAPGRSGAAGRGEVGQGRGRPAGRLVDDAAAVVGGDPGQPLAPRPAAPREEPLERPARPGHPGRGHGGEDRRRARDGHDRAALGGPGPDELLARVADPGRPGVGHEGEVGPRRRCATSSGRRPAAFRAWKLTRRTLIS